MVKRARTVAAQPEQTGIAVNGSLGIDLAYNTVDKLVMMRFHTVIKDAFLTADQAIELGEALVKNGKMARGITH